MKLLLLCGLPKVTEWKKCSEPIRRNACNEVTGGSGTLFCLKNWEFFNYRKYTMLINKTNGDLNRHIFSYFQIYQCIPQVCSGWEKQKQHFSISGLNKRCRKNKTKILKKQQKELRSDCLWKKSDASQNTEICRLKITRNL